MRRKIIIVNSNYPSEDNRYGDVFVHSRLLYYLPHVDVQVLGYKKGLKKSYQYNYEGIDVEVETSPETLVERIKEHNPDLLGFHFIEGWMVDKIVKHFKNLPSLIWVHGFEALGWYRRLFYVEANVRSLLSFSKYTIKNNIQMFLMRKLISYSNKIKNVHFIFVSNWMKNTTEADTFSKIINYSIIPNPRDPIRFKYNSKEAGKRKKILLIRSFDNKKYANDLAIDAILILSRKNRALFDDLEFSIYGKGKFFDHLTGKIKEFKNVAIFNDFIENKDIPNVHRDHGLFLCPTRQDAQGVSMCEAMSSGLVPISSNNTAIPEFLKDQKTGFLTSSSDEIAASIEYLYNNPDTFLSISEEASKSIREISSTESVVKSELKLILSSLG